MEQTIPHFSDVPALADYLQAHPEIVEVVLSPADYKRLGDYAGPARRGIPRSFLFANVKFRQAGAFPGYTLDWSSDAVF